MIKVRLVNLPFSSILRPAIGLTQIKSRIQVCFGDRVNVEIEYLNMDFSLYMGVEFYNEVAESMDHHSTGLGDWFFRQVAFPELSCNTDEYFQRCYPHPGERTRRLKKLVEEKRRNLPSVLRQLIEKYSLDQADVVGFSSTFAQTVACIGMARLLKQCRPDVVTVMGGANCESTMGQEIAKNVRAVDFVFSGPALVTFPRFIENYLDGKFSEMNAIPGVFSRENQSRSPFSLVEQPSIVPVGEELNIDIPVNLDYADYLAKFSELYRDKEIRPTLLFETSRGCWWGEKAHCTFCGLNGETMAYRSMKPDRAVTLIQSLFRHADVCSRFDSVDNIMPKHYVEEVFPRLCTPPNTLIFYEVKADLAENDLAVLSKAGVNLIQPGIESLATSTLQLMKKGTTATQNVRFLRNCLMNGVRPAWNLLVGFPGEREDVYRKYCSDLPLLTHLFPPSGVFPVRFDRFSPYFSKASQYELDLHPMAHYGLTYPFDKHTLFNLAYYFSDHHVEAEYFVAMVEWIGQLRAKVREWQRLWDRHFNAGSEPKLHFLNETSGELLDSRSGEKLYYDVGRCGRHLLESLNKPKTASMLAQEFPDESVAHELEALKARGLLFWEGERAVGLVCPHKPPACPAIG